MYKSWTKNYKATNEILGSGGNAKVSKVIDCTTQKTYALKELHPKKNYEECKNRFCDEIQIITTYANTISGIIPIIKSNKNECWYIMPIAIPITKYVKTKELSIQNIVKGFTELTETLIKLHNKNICHRDIKPENIYYYNNRFCLGDFGLVEFPNNPHNHTRNNRGLGAIFTIAPEMKRNPKNADGKKADVFSLAKTLWMLLTNEAKGFDGPYDFSDETHSLRYNERTKNMYTVEIEELLADATSNDYESRPTMISFKRRLEKWLKILPDQIATQENQWNFLAKYLFGRNIPESVRWSNTDAIVEVLNTLSLFPVLNHMFFSDGGGLDFSETKLANEEGCIYIKPVEIISTVYYLLKPKCLYYEGFSDYKWNYFLLEFDSLKPIFDNTHCSEYLVEDFDAHYVSSKYFDYGVYDYDTGEKLPDNSKLVKRYIKGKFLITLKFGPYNKISSTYDGRHGDCSSIEFRDYIESINDLCKEAKKKGIKEEIVLNLDILTKNPFKINEPQLNLEKTSVIASKEIEANDILNIQFSIHHETQEKSSPSQFAIILSDKKSSGTFFEYDANNNQKYYLQKDGYFKSEESSLSIEIHYMYNRQFAIDTIQSCKKQIKQYCQENVIETPISMLFLDMEIKKIGTPEHMFSCEEVYAAMQNADDRKHNILVIDEYGYAKVISDSEYSHLYPVTGSTYAAGNCYVGKYSDLITHKDDYHHMLQGWLLYLQTGRPQNKYTTHPQKSIEELRKEITNYYN